MNFKYFVILAIFIISIFSGCIDTRTTKAYSIGDKSYYIRNPCDNSSVLEVSEYEYYTMEEKPCYKNISNGV